MLDISETLITLQVGNQACCTHAHAFFNGLWDDGEGRPNRTYRRYLKAAQRAPMSDERTKKHDEQKRLHTSLWVRNRIVNTLGQTFAIMAGGGDVVVQANGAVDTEWEYRIRPPVLKHAPEPCGRHER